MITAPFIAEIAALVGDPARANMLLAVMDGRALTAGELAYAARVAPQTASGHLGKLVGARLLALEKQGRHRYFRLASPAVADLLEGLMAVAVDGAPRYRPSSCGDAALRLARTCYDHLAGLPIRSSHAGISSWTRMPGKLPLMVAGFLTNSILTLPVRRVVDAGFAGHVWIGVSGGGTSEAQSERRWPDAASNLAGSSA
jgi:DNA-binding transcriptional ArsR family regulator